MGYNPCAEQSLAAYETCCLAEVYLPNIESKEQLLDVCQLLYRINKHSLALPCHLKETEDIVHKNMRMGIGVTGVLQATEEQRSWLNETYRRLREFDFKYSHAHNFPESVKLTTVKPSGTLSLLPGVTSGCHPAYSQYMIRRIRIAADHPLVQVCREHGYPVEYQRHFDGSEDHSTMVVSFPFCYPEGTKIAAEMTAIDQLEVVKWLQANWSDNSVSCTVYYRKEELPEIQKYLAKNYKNNHKSLSFLLHNEHGFHQAPLEEITKEAYDALVASTQLITHVDEALFDGGDECASGACPVK
jgi:ribonucleotide reductase alpha subunit